MTTWAAWAEWADEQTAAIRAAGQWRAPRTFDAAGPEGDLQITGETGAEVLDVVSFASNDYLGLTQHPALKAAAIAATEQWGTGSGAARLIVGSRPPHAELEHELAAYRGADAAVLFGTGFAANSGTLAVLGGPGVRIHSDELNHASLIDGCRMAKSNGAELRVYRHRQLDHLESTLAAPGADGTVPDRQVVVTDTVFSMDGDVADVAALGELCDRYGALLVLDDAHAVLESVPVPQPANYIRIGTLSKTFGSFGGFVTASRAFTDLLVNRSRPYIFTTASPPAEAAASLAALRVIRSPEGDALRARLRANINRVVPGHPSPVVPVVIGDELDAVEAAAGLLKRGIFVPAIRPPTVAPGSSRLRVALSAAHTDEQLDRLVAAFDELALHPTDHGS